MKNTIKLYQLEELQQAGVVKQFEESERQIYYVSKYGNFYSQSKSNLVKIKQINLSPDRQGYLRANINSNTTKVHIVVAEKFIKLLNTCEDVNYLTTEFVFSFNT